jgi:hypothetical protein
VEENEKRRFVVVGAGERIKKELAAAAAVCCVCVY